VKRNPFYFFVFPDGKKKRKNKEEKEMAITSIYVQQGRGEKRKVNCKGEDILYVRRDVPWTKEKREGEEKGRTVFVLLIWGRKKRGREAKKKEDGRHRQEVGKKGGIPLFRLSSWGSGKTSHRGEKSSVSVGAKKREGENRKKGGGEKRKSFPGGVGVLVTKGGEMKKKKGGASGCSPCCPKKRGKRIKKGVLSLSMWGKGREEKKGGQGRSALFCL